MATVEQSKRIPLTLMKKNGHLENRMYEGVFNWWHNGHDNGSANFLVDSRHSAQENYLELSYIHVSGEEIQFRIKMDYTVPHFGGRRWVFICPIQGCSNRTRILFQVGKYFGCRKCAGVIYNSQNNPELTRGYPWVVYDLERRKRNIKRKVHNGGPTKRYQRLLNKYGKYGIASIEQAYVDVDRLSWG